MKFLKIVLALSLVSVLGSNSFAKNGVYPTKFKIVPQALDGSASNKANNLLYYGGPVISNVRVVTVFWGSSVDSELQQNLAGFYSSIVNSTQMDWLDQYSTFGKSLDGRQGTNQHIGRGSYITDVIIQPKNTSKNLDDTEIQAEIESQIANNTLPKPDQNTIYMIHFPAGIAITIEGMKSCQDFCAYHEGFKSKTFGDVFYGVMPDFKAGACSMGCALTGNAFDTTTVISSHELIEAVTDPFPTPGDKPAFPQAWNTANGSEIADLCPSAANLKTSKRTYKISKEWDNKTKSCYAGPFQSSL